MIIFHKEVQDCFHTSDHIANYNRTRTSRRNKNYINHLSEGTVDRSTFQMKQRSNISIDPVEIQLPEYKCNGYSKTPIPIVGNMIDDGWEVYHGIDYNSIDLNGFKDELDILLKDHHSKFNGIASTNRKIIILSSLECLMNQKICNLRVLYQAFSILHSKVLKKVSYLEEVILDYKAVLSNIGQVEEQQPHRDYLSIKK